MPSGTGRRRGALWMCAATAVVVVAGADRAAAQEPRVASTAADDAQELPNGLLAPASPSTAPQAAVIVPSSERTTEPATSVTRWLDVQTGTVATRFRYTEATTGSIVHDQQQFSEQFKARLKIDRSGAYAVSIAVGTGNGFVKGWNNTALGTPSGYTSSVFVKQLFASASPVKGLEIQAGGLGLVRGENTEVTSYDNDGYIAGERVTVKYPRTLHVDELSMTMAYLGDAATPGLWQRLPRFSEPNYYQVFAAKRFSARFSSSADVTTVAGATTVRTGFKLDTPDFRWTNSIRVEQYARFNDAAYGYAISGERVVARRFTLCTGLADIDQNYGGLNGDRFGSGRRWFTTDTIALGRELSAQIFYTHTVFNGFEVQNRQALQVLLTYNVAKGLERLTSR